MVSISKAVLLTQFCITSTHYPILTTLNVHVYHLPPYPRASILFVLVLCCNEMLSFVDVDEDYILDAFVFQHSCAQVNQYHSEMIDPTHRYFDAFYALQFRRFRYRCKIVPDYHDDYSRSLLTNVKHCRKMNWESPFFIPQYNYYFHVRQSLKALSYNYFSVFVLSPPLLGDLTNIDLLLMLEVPRFVFTFDNF